MIAGFLREFSFAVAAFARALKQPCVSVLLVFFLSELLVDEVDAFADLVEGTLLLLPIASAYRGKARLPSLYSQFPRLLPGLSRSSRTLSISLTLSSSALDCTRLNSSLTWSFSPLPLLPVGRSIVSTLLFPFQINPVPTLLRRIWLVFFC